jgi:dihydrofolate synthase/folylpolyglutamate synthase
VKPRAFLEHLQFHGVKLGLENISRLLEPLGNPHLRYPTVHVGGTNGKGSVVAFVDAMLRAGGYRTGRFTSPHLIALNERFLVDGRPIDDDELDRCIGLFQRITRDWETPPTYFEVATAVAFWHFATCQVDCAVIEVGMGGRFDSTNVVRPEACAITTVDLDHTRWLGTTRAEIAREKAGIIKPGTPVVVGEMDDEAREVILQRAAELRTRVRLVGRDFTYRLEPGGEGGFAFQRDGLALERVSLGLPGQYQGANAAVAVVLAQELQFKFPGLTREAIETGLRDASWPGRFERVLDDPPVIIDVAHNPAGSRTLAAQAPRGIVVFSVSSDKDVAAMLDALDPIAERYVFTQFEGARALEVEALCGIAGDRPMERADTVEAALARGMDLAGPERPLIVTGSVYLAGEARRILTERYGAPPPRF